MLIKRSSDDLETKLKNNYLLGINASTRKVRLTFRNKETNKIFSEEVRVDENKLKQLHAQRRMDCIEILNDFVNIKDPYEHEKDNKEFILYMGDTKRKIKTFNDVYLYEIKEPQIADMGFDIIDNMFILKYYVSTDILRNKEERNFLNDIVSKYCDSRRVYKIDNKVLDFIALKDREKVPLSSNVILIDSRDYIQKMHIEGKNICPFLMNYVEGVKETQEYMKSNGRRRR